MTTLLSFLFVLGVLIFVHELGHFLAARRLGVRVLTFSLGFGPKIFNVKRGDTDYCISAIPLGGYVKMAGENPDEPRSGRPEEFLSRTKWERFQVLIMGPAMNIILAVVVMALVLAQGAEVPAYQDQAPVVGGVVSGGPADRAGVRPGDRVLTIAGVTIDTWDKLFLEIGTRSGQNVSMALLRNGRDAIEVNLQPQAQGRYEIGDIGILPDVGPRVQSLFAGDPAERAGLMQGDEVIAVNGTRVAFARQLSEELRKYAGREVALTVRRGGQEMQFTMRPERRDEYPAWIGITMGDATKTFNPTAWEAMKLSVARNIEFSGLIFRTLGGLFVGETSLRQLQGPVAIAQLSGESAEAGWIALFTLMASISLNLGLLNLLPIPVLDGGHILIMALEGVARRDFSTAVKEKMLLTGFVLLMMLMVTVIYNDLMRISWIEQLIPWRN